MNEKTAISLTIRRPGALPSSSIGLTLFCVSTLIACKPVGTIALKDVPDPDTQTGFIRPLMPEELRPGGAASGEPISLGELSYVLQLDPFEVEAKAGRVVVAPNGETLLVVDPTGDLPGPAFSVPRPPAGAKRQVYQWSEIVSTGGTGIIKTNMFLRHPLDSDLEYAREHIYMLRQPRSKAGEATKVLVPWTRHFRSGDGQVFYRIGNSVLSTATHEPVVQLQVIGRFVWRVWGVYQDSGVCSGTVFWAEQTTDGRPTELYWSQTQGQPDVLKWRAQGDFMVMVDQVPVATAEIPRIVSQNLSPCETFDVGNPPLSAGLDTNLLDQAVLPLEAGEWERPSVTKLAPKRSSTELSAFDALYEFEGDEAEVGGQADGLALAGSISAFKRGQKYKSDTLIQIPDGTIHRVVRTIEHQGWFGDYYSYDTINHSSDRDGKQGRIAYKIDAKGRVTDKRHIKTFAAEMAKDIKAINVKKVEDRRLIAAQMAANREQLRHAEVIAAQVDSFKKIATLTLANYAFDQVGRMAGVQVFNKNLALTSRLKAAGAVTANTVAMTALLDWANNPDRPAEDRGQMLAVQSLSSGSAWSIYAAGAGDARVSFIAGTGVEGAYIIQQRAMGYDTPDWLTTGERLVANGTVAAGQTAVLSQAFAAIKSQGLQGAAAQSVLDKARMKARFMVGGGDIARLYFQDNLTVSAASGTALETAVSMIPAGPVWGIPKAMGMTLAKQVNAMLQLTESLVRNRRTSNDMDESFMDLRNKWTTEGAVEVIEALDGTAFHGLESTSNGNAGVPDEIVRAKERNN